VTEVADIWRDKRDELEPRLRELKARETHAHDGRPGDLDPGIVGSIAALIRGQYDAEYGGFGREPKFPQPKLLRFLIDAYRRTPRSATTPSTRRVERRTARRSSIAACTPAGTRSPPPPTSRRPTPLARIPRTTGPWR